MQENDSVLMFLNECDGIKIGEGLRAHSSTLYIAYERFCRDNMLTPLKERSFLSMLKTKGRNVFILPVLCDRKDLIVQILAGEILKHCMG